MIIEYPMIGFLAMLCTIFCACSECANNKQAFSGYALIIIEYPHMDIRGHHYIGSSYFCICQNSFSFLFNNHP